MIEALWDLFEMLADGVDEDQLEPALVLRRDGSGRFSLNRAHVLDVKYPAWAIEQGTQAEWRTLTEGVAMLAALLRKKFGTRGAP